MTFKAWTGVATFKAEGDINVLSSVTLTASGGNKAVFDTDGYSLSVGNDLTVGQSGDLTRYGHANFGSSDVTISDQILVYPSDSSNNKISLTSGTMTIGGNFTNNDTFNPGTGSVSFIATDADNTITTGSNGTFYKRHLRRRRRWHGCFVGTSGRHGH